MIMRAQSSKKDSKIVLYQAIDRIIQPDIVAEPSISANYQLKKSVRPTLKIDSATKKSELQEGHLKYNSIDSISSARQGISFEKFKNIFDLLPFSTFKWAEILGVSERTMQIILKEKRDLDQNKSEKLLAFLSLVDYALEIFGSITHFQEWLQYKSPALGGKAAIDFVDTYQGITMLKEILFKIETGNLA